MKTKRPERFGCRPSTRAPFGEACPYPTCHYVAIAESVGAAAEAMLDHLAHTHIQIIIAVDLVARVVTPA